jgi:hypothetical protein
MNWETKIKEALERAREWWGELDETQQQLVATVGALTLLAMIERQNKSRPTESVIRLKVE